MATWYVKGRAFTGTVYNVGSIYRLAVSSPPQLTLTNTSTITTYSNYNYPYTASGSLGAHASIWVMYVYSNSADDGQNIDYNPSGAAHPIAFSNTGTGSEVTGFIPMDNMPPQEYTITYNANGGSGEPASGTKTHDVGYTIAGGPSTAKSYTITYNANEGSVSPSSKSVSCSFNGWNTDSSGTGTDYSPGQSYIINSNLYLYAKWSNPTAGQLATPTRTGYDFDGWFTEASGGTQVTSSTTITGDTIVYAHWIRNEAKCYRNYDSSDTNYQTVQASTSTGKITLPSLTRAGYEFLGWYTDRSGGTKVGDGGDEYTPTSSTIDLFAHWKLTTYVYKWNGTAWEKTSRAYKWNGSSWNNVDQGHMWNSTTQQWEPIVPSGS